MDGGEGEGEGEGEEDGEDFGLDKDELPIEEIDDF